MKIYTEINVRHIGLLFYISIVFVLLICSTAFSQIYVDTNATGANNGTSWTNAYTNLQIALDRATSGDQVWVAKGTSSPVDTGRASTFDIPFGVSVYGGFTVREFDISQRVNFRHGVANKTILSGSRAVQGTNSHSHF